MLFGLFATSEDIARRLEREADRLENGGDPVGAQQAREAAMNARQSGSRAGARQAEAAFRARRTVFQGNSITNTNVTNVYPGYDPYTDQSFNTFGDGGNYGSPGPDGSYSTPGTAGQPIDQPVGQHDDTGETSDNS